MIFEFIIREATAVDAAQLARLNEKFNGNSDPPEVLAVRLADPRQVEIALVAESNGRLVAFAGLRVVPGLFYTEPQSELTELYVEDDYRKQGIGRALIEDAAWRAREAGATGLVVRTGKDNAAALHLYHACGFAEEDIALWKILTEMD